MTSPDDWSDLAKMWQADAARVPLAEIDAHLERERRHLRGVTIAEMLGLAVGIVAATLVLLFTPRVWMGVVIILFGGVSSWIMMRLRREIHLGSSVDLMQSLKDSMEREDWMGSQLRLGRALSFVALFAIVSGLSAQLHQARAFSANVMVAAGIGSAVVVAALAWNYVLTRRSRRRMERLRYLHDRLKA